MKSYFNRQALEKHPLTTSARFHIDPFEGSHTSLSSSSPHDRMNRSCLAFVAAYSSENAIKGNGCSKNKMYSRVKMH